MTLSHESDKVSGTWVADDGTAGTVSATVTDGNRLDPLAIAANQISGSTTHCYGTLSGSGTYDDDNKLSASSMSGTLSGTSCGVTTSSFSLQKQEQD